MMSLNPCLILLNFIYVSLTTDRALCHKCKEQICMHQEIYMLWYLTFTIGIFCQTCIFYHQYISTFRNVVIILQTSLQRKLMTSAGIFRPCKACKPTGRFIILKMQIICKICCHTINSTKLPITESPHSTFELHIRYTIITLTPSGSSLMYGWFLQHIASKFLHLIYFLKSTIYRTEAVRRHYCSSLKQWGADWWSCSALYCYIMC